MTEDQLQAKCFQWCNNTYLGRALIYAVPNGGTRDPREAAKFKATGTRAGVADLHLLMPGGRLVLIELKTLTGKQSPAQIGYEGIVKEFGFEYYICRTFEEFKELITKLMI